MTVRIGTRVTGVVERGLAASPRLRVETFRMRFDGLKVWPEDSTPHEDVLLGQSRFDGLAGSALVLWDAAAPQLFTASDAVAFFDGNLERDDPDDLETVDASQATPLTDAQFWPVIDRLNGRTWERDLSAAERLLSEHDEQFILRWAETAGRKALVLADAFQSAGDPASDQLHFIGATLGQGRQAYDRVRMDPGEFDGACLNDNSQQVTWLASGALRRRRKTDLWIKTSFSPRHRSILHRAHAEDEAYRIGKGIAPEAPRPAYRAARAVVLLDGRYRERLVLLDVEGLDGSASLEKAKAVIKSFGGDIAAGPEFAVGGAIEDLFNWPVFTIKRRSTSPVDDYLNRYATRL